MRAFVEQIRAKLDDDAADPGYIFNERNGGYRIPRPGEGMTGKRRGDKPEADPQDTTGGYAMDQSMEQFRDATQRIADRVDGLIRDGTPARAPAWDGTPRRAASTVSANRQQEQIRSRYLAHP